MTSADPITGSPAKAGPREIALGLTLLGLCVVELISLYTGNQLSARVAAVLLVVFVVAGQGHFRLRERYLLVLAVAVTIAVLTLAPDAGPLIGRAFGQASYLAAFMILLGLLRDGATSSSSVLALGSYLTRRPPGKRYLAIALGGHALGVVLNFGALSLLGPLIQRGIDAGRGAEPRLAAVRERRQMSALARGFSWIIAWSPTAVTQALVPSVVIGAAPGRLAIYGAAIAMVVFLVGWLEDRVVGARARRALARDGALPERSLRVEALPRRALLRFSMVCLALAAISLIAIELAQVTVIPALMLGAPLVTAAWIWRQSGLSPNRNAAALSRLKEIGLRSVPQGSPEALTLAAAGYVGVMAAGLTDAGGVADAIGFREIPPLAVYLAATAMVPVLSCLATPPMLTVTFVGSLASALPDSHLDPTLLALALILGWTLNLTGSPFGATSLILSRITGIAGLTLAWRWNGLFSLAAYGVIAIAMSLLSAGFG